MADDSHFTIVFARVLDLKRYAGKDNLGIFEIQPTLFQRSLALLGIVGHAHRLL